jgi:hypothetical protein
MFLRQDRAVLAFEDEGLARLYREQAPLRVPDLQSHMQQTIYLMPQAAPLNLRKGYRYFVSENN